MNSKNTYTEQKLFSLIADGDEEAFADFYLLVKTDCSAYAYRVLQSKEGVKEVLQESLIRLWLHRDKLYNIEQPKAWFFRIVANECTRYLSKYGFKEVNVGQPDEDHYTGGSYLNHTELEVSYRETERIIASVVATLPPKRKEIYQLSREQGLTQQQIADHLDVSRDYIKKALMAALQVIRKRLVEEGIFVPVIIFLLY